jgi:hypothetical protein
MPPSVAVKQKPEELSPKDAILQKLGDLSKYEICNNEVLLAIYHRPRMTPGGIIMPDQNLKEDLWQAKAHLVVKMGPTCDFPLVKIELHDWIIMRPSDGWALDINMRPDILLYDDYVHCRMAYDKHIRAKVPHPGIVW